MPPVWAGFMNTPCRTARVNTTWRSLRSIQDWFLKFELQTVPGVAEVATVGGMVKQYQVVVNPDALRAYDLPLAKIRTRDSEGQSRSRRFRD